ncbi:endonuclease YncB(thermonuclease family) [Melghirimyces profundicolus]|uniref:Endonuclease YncB(Thermonuclease family) n=1 Tax=Melghirimyces profundicolus TaxID=1242148 RepID=A0A2T6C7T8_9BACL|nr:thermonuclease family protein [Melghirimyces profundicolus]PTX64388.1 endonuclease YncB(thermonuclease family) [Melghirimyces profundicolus]
MRKPVIFFLTLFLMFSLVVLPDSSVQAATYTSTVEYVKDGDTILLTKPVNGTREVRLVGIDAPETFTVDGKDPGNQVEHGEDATAYLEQLLPKGTSVTMVTDQEEMDGSGRLLAYVYKDGMDVNEEMLRQGHAVTYVIWPNTHDTTRFEAYRDAMLDAESKGLGVWDPNNPLEELPFEYRDRMFDEEQDKYVGDFYTREYVDPLDYEQIPMENRVFFFTEQDALDAGYTHQ